MANMQQLRQNLTQNGLGSVKQIVLEKYEISRPETVDPDYHKEASEPFILDAQKDAPTMVQLTEPEFTNEFLRPVLSWPFKHDRSMPWSGSEAWVELAHKADGIVQLISNDAAGYEILILEVSSKLFKHNLTKLGTDAFNIGREMKHCFDHAILKVQAL
ncbi:hypothetical protein HDU80_001626, partial [Chytriomyces hyalinus]